MKTVPWALCRPSIVMMMRAADAGPAMKINVATKEKNRLRQRMLGFAPLEVAHLSPVANKPGGEESLKHEAMVGADRRCVRSRQSRVLGSPAGAPSATESLDSVQGVSVSLLRLNRESRVKNAHDAFPSVEGPVLQRRFDRA